MKKFGMILAFLAVALFSNSTLAEEEYSPHKDSSGRLGTPAFLWRTGDIDTLTVNTALMPRASRYLHLPLVSFVINNGAANEMVQPITNRTAPGLQYDDAMWNVVYQDGETSPIERVFVVPNDYLSGPTFELFLTRSGGTQNPPSVDFEVYINTHHQVIDGAVTGQTPVELDGNYVTSPQKLTLTVTSDFSTLLAGDRVTFRVWRDNTDPSTEDVEFKGDILFIYTGSR